MGRQFPEQRTAFIVIHGIGEQNPFETLDSFTRGLVEELKSQGVPCEASHRITEQKNAQGTEWAESYVRLTPPEGNGSIDIHEYYWAYLTEEKITVTEVWQWVERTLEGTRNFYRENEALVHQYEKDGKVRFRLERVARDLRRLSLLYPLIRFAISILSLFSRLTPLQVLQRSIDGLKGLLKPVIVGYIGDIAIYTTMDEKSRFFKLRQQILAHSQALLEAILAGHNYERVIIAGHSLGSVIAYDTLNRLNIKANLPSGSNIPVHKVAGLITFGSPLDKIAFFFREHAGKEQCVRRQIMEQLHSFKAKPLSLAPNAFPLANPLSPKLDGIPWVNYFNDKDPVSGHLDFYKIPDEDNVRLDLPEPWGVAHVGYWGHKPFYADIARRFL